MNIEIIITPELQVALDNLKRKDTRLNLLKIYSALVFKNLKFNKTKANSFFPVPSKYLESINSRYYKYIDMLLDNSIIDYLSNNSIDVYDSGDITDDVIHRKKYYNTFTNLCMQYKFTNDITIGKTVEIDLDVSNLYTDNDWYKITKKSLNDILLPESHIKRDSFSRRLHTSITANTGVEGFSSYKTYLNALGGYSNIDIIECQPSLLLQVVEPRFIDANYKIGRIYKQIDTDRDKAKIIFVQWLNSEVVAMPRVVNELFPLMTIYVKRYKAKSGYKALANRLQYKEAKIVIDDLLNNINMELKVDFALTVHDSIICKKEDAEKVKKWCEKKYTYLKFRNESL